MVNHHFDDCKGTSRLKSAFLIEIYLNIYPKLSSQLENLSGFTSLKIYYRSHIGEDGLDCSYQFKIHNEESQISQGFLSLDLLLNFGELVFRYAKVKNKNPWSVPGELVCNMPSTTLFLLNRIAPITL